MQLIDLIRIAGMTALLSLIWAGSIAFTYWDLHRQPPSGGKTTLWLLLVVVLPLLGFAIYLSVKILNTLLTSKQNQAPARPRRETALKRPAPQRNPTSTILASDLTAETILKPEDVAGARSERQKPSPTYIFTVTSGADSGKEFPVEKLPVYIGRDSDSLIFLSGDLGISRKHAEIYDRDGAIRIRDLKSTHGTQVNGQRIDDKDLVPGDRIQVGRTILVVKADDG
jgi:hypothetical protein